MSGAAARGSCSIISAQRVHSTPSQLACLVQAVGHNERLLLRQHASLQLSGTLVIAAVAVCRRPAARGAAPLRASKPVMQGRLGGWASASPHEMGLSCTTGSAALAHSFDFASQHTQTFVHLLTRPGSPPRS